MQQSSFIGAHFIIIIVIWLRASASLTLCILEYKQGYVIWVTGLCGHNAASQMAPHPHTCRASCVNITILAR